MLNFNISDSKLNFFFFFELLDLKKYIQKFNIWS